MATKTKKEIIAERQEVVRRHMLSEVEASNILTLLATADYEGKAMLIRWYLFGQVALYKNGELLHDDANWSEIKAEMSIPSSFWIWTLTKRQALSDVGRVVTDFGYQFPRTDLGRDNDNPRIYTMSWWNNSIRDIRRLQVLDWLGIVGGVVE